MTKFYLLAIPLSIGMIVGMFLAFYPESQNDSKLLTTSKLMENGSPILGNSNAPITMLEWGDYQCTFCHNGSTGHCRKGSNGPRCGAG